MTAQEILSRLKAWTDEYGQLAERVSLPEKYLPFLAKRLVESGLGQEEPDVVCVTLPSGEVERCRITGIHSAGFLTYSYADAGRMGSGICPVGAIIPQDKPKLAELLDRLEGVHG